MEELNGSLFIVATSTLAYCFKLALKIGYINFYLFADKYLFIGGIAKKSA